MRGHPKDHLLPSPCNPPATARHLEQTQITPAPFTPLKSNQKTQKCRQRRQTVLQRFLAMSATIGRICVLVFNCANPQGVQSDSLEGCKFPGAVYTFFAHGLFTIVLYVL
jgi:hypothetical protein